MFDIPISKEEFSNILYESLDSDKSMVHERAFYDIAGALYDWRFFQDKMILNASMGHGKTTVLRQFITCMSVGALEQMQDASDVYLVVVKENSQATHLLNEDDFFYTIAPEIMDWNITLLNHENSSDIKTLMELNQKRFLIITHERFKRLALEYRETGRLDKSIFIHKNGQPRRIIVDEKPEFCFGYSYNGSEFITEIDKLVKKLSRTNKDFTSDEFDALRYKVAAWLVDQFYESNPTNQTIHLKVDDYLFNIIKRIKRYMKGNHDFFHEYYYLDTIEKLMKHEIIGHFGTTNEGKYLYYSEHLPYHELSNEILILDGTSHIEIETAYPRVLRDYLYKIENYTDYTRLHLYHIPMNTNKSSKDKERYDRYHKIAKELSEQHPDLFVLADKEDLEFMFKKGYLHKNEYISDNHDKLFHLYNTTGKNLIHDRESLFICANGKYNPQYYILMALANKQSDDDLNLDIDSDPHTPWFPDETIHRCYKFSLAANMMQIIHRTNLRHIDSTKPIHIYLAQKDKHSMLFENMKFFMKNQVTIEEFRDKPIWRKNTKLVEFYNMLKGVYIKDYLKLTSIKNKSVKGKEFHKYIKNHYHDNYKNTELNNMLSELGLYLSLKKLDEDKKDTYYLIKIK